MLELELEVSALCSHARTPRHMCQDPHSWLLVTLLPALCPATAPETGTLSPWLKFVCSVFAGAGGNNP